MLQRIAALVAFRARSPRARRARRAPGPLAAAACIVAVAIGGCGGDASQDGGEAGPAGPTIDTASWKTYTDGNFTVSLPDGNFTTKQSNKFTQRGDSMVGVVVDTTEWMEPSGAPPRMLRIDVTNLPGGYAAPKGHTLRDMAIGWISAMAHENGATLNDMDTAVDGHQGYGGSYVSSAGVYFRTLSFYIGDLGVRLQGQGGGEAGRAFVDAFFNTLKLHPKTTQIASADDTSTPGTPDIEPGPKTQPQPEPEPKKIEPAPQPDKTEAPPKKADPAPRPKVEPAPGPKAEPEPKPQPEPEPAPQPHPLDDLAAKDPIVAHIRDLESSDLRTRHDAEEALEKAKLTGKHIQPLMLIVGRTDDTFSKKAALELVAKIGTPAAADALAAKLADEDLRHHLTFILRDMGAAAEPAVLRQLSSRDDEVLREACSLLGHIGTRRSLVALKSLAARTKDAFVKLSAESAIRRIERK